MANAAVHPELSIGSLTLVPFTQRCLGKGQQKGSAQTAASLSTSTGGAGSLAFTVVAKSTLIGRKLSSASKNETELV
jgi:hypothetical protein